MLDRHEIAVGSTNPIKAKSVLDAYSAVFPEHRWECHTCNVESGVSEQPLDEHEALRGAINRSRAALEAVPIASWGVGIEGGLCTLAGTTMECGIVVVTDRDGRRGTSSSARIMVPRPISTLLRRGMDLTRACDELLGTEDLGRGEGFFGIMTNSATTRLSAYTDAVAFALAPWVHSELFAPAPPCR